MLKRVKTWLAQSYTCRYCDGSGYESNLRMLWNQIRSWGFVALATVILAIKFWPAAAPVAPPIVLPASTASR